MTTLVLQAADSLIGGIANTAASLATQALSGALTGGSGHAGARIVEGPRLADMPGLASTEGAPIPRLYGRARLGGQLIWATRFEEIATTRVERSASRGGKSFGGSSAAARTTVTTTYAYVANLAIGLCEGPIAFVRRVWADGAELDLTTLAMRVHPGLATQPPDPLIVAKEGAADAPAYRGLAYVVFERLPLAQFGNRVPQFSFEVVRPPAGLAEPGLPEMIRAVCLIPGSTEFGYDTLPVSRTLGLGASAPENIFQLQRGTDVAASLDWLQALCPNLARVSLVVSWFGDDLRAGSCTIAPRVDIADKATSGADWAVAGLTRATARVVSSADGRAAYGGTPSDAGVVRLIRELKSRGLAVTLYPFVLMDVPAGNALPNPTGGTGQPAYPWRGRITCHPAPGLPGSPDNSAASAPQIAAFFGMAAPGHFTVAGETVTYAGPVEWSFRRHILHGAALAKAAGGVDAFLIGSELVGLTRVRGTAGSYPAAAALRTLAADVKGMLGTSTRVTYAADWTEYGAHVPGDGSVRFPLDQLWADPAIDAVAIDYYPPLSDWRDTPGHADLALGAGPADADYLRGRLGAGEAFDWFYADAAARAAQLRTPITDGAYGEPWVFRPKDLVGWWSNSHVERSGGAEVAATAWMPGMKPIWLNEIGIPAVDKGPNGPNVFPDPKSSESALPPFSRGTRDDLVQARGLAAILSRFDHALPGFRPEGNPAATAYAGRMVDPVRTSVWCWDARPFPAFPDFEGVWADGANWHSGHWITGRIEGAPLDRLVAAILAEYGLAAGADIRLDGFADGYVIDRPMSARDALAPLAELFGFGVATRCGATIWRANAAAAPALALAPDDLVGERDDPPLRRVRAQETDLPAALEIGFTDSAGEYARAAAGSRRLAGTSRREVRRDVALVTTRAEAGRLAETGLRDVWSGRERAEFALSPRLVAVEPGDVIALDPGSGGDPAASPTRLRVTQIVDGAARRVSAVAVAPVAAGGSAPALPARPRTPPAIAGPLEALLFALPVAPADPPPLLYAAVAAAPWPGAVAVWRSDDAAAFRLERVIDLPAVIGRTLTPLPAGPVWRWDAATRLDVALSAAAFSSVGDAEALAGGNAFAVEGSDGTWEILSAATVDLVGTRTYRLSRLLRGLAGSEANAAIPVPAGARIVRLDEGVVSLTTDPADLGRVPIFRIGPADRDHADPLYVEIAVSVERAALRPLRPVQIRARRRADVVTIGWIRRTRRDGDSWDLAEVPLGEESERYQVEIRKGGALVRTLAAGTNSILYPSALELADFGASQGALDVAVAQIGTATGSGAATRVVVDVLPG